MLEMEADQEELQVAVDYAHLRLDKDPQTSGWQQTHQGQMWYSPHRQMLDIIKERLAKGPNTKAGSHTLLRKIRSAQYEYWHRGEDICWGAYMSDIVA